MLMDADDLTGLFPIVVRSGDIQLLFRDSSPGAPLEYISVTTSAKLIRAMMAKYAAVFGPPTSDSEGKQSWVSHGTVLRLTLETPSSGRQDDGYLELYLEGFDPFCGSPGSRTRR